MQAGILLARDNERGFIQPVPLEQTSLNQNLHRLKPGAGKTACPEKLFGNTFGNTACQPAAGTVPSWKILVRCNTEYGRYQESGGGGKGRRGYVSKWRKPHRQECLCYGCKNPL